MTMDEIADRVEAAEGADRELDLAIGLAVLGWKWVEDDFGDYLILDFGAAHQVGWRKGEAIPDCIPHITGSLDGAASLIPDGAHFDIRSDGRDGDDEPYAFVHQRHWSGHTIFKTSGSANAATPALALCAAALRARARKTGDEM